MASNGAQWQRRSGLLGALGIGRSSASSVQAQSDSHRQQLSGANQPAPASGTPLATQSSHAAPIVPRLLAIRADDHALELLAWLQGPGGRTGSVSAADLAKAHADMCAALEIEPIGWVAVGRELRRLLGQPRLYVDRSGRRVRTYLIPPAGVELRPRAAGRWAGAVETSRPIPIAA